MALACPSLRFVFLTCNRDECWGGAASRPALNQTFAAARRRMMGVCVFARVCECVSGCRSAGALRTMHVQICVSLGNT